MAWFKTTPTEIRGIYHSDQSDFERLEAFIKANGFNRMHGWNTGDKVEKIIRSGSLVSNGRFECTYPKKPPYIDHPRYFKNTQTKVCCLTYSPYYDADDIREEISEWANSLGLKAEVYDSSESWYSPGNTCFVVISLPEVEIKLKPEKLTTQMQKYELIKSYVSTLDISSSEYEGIIKAVAEVLKV